MVDFEKLKKEYNDMKSEKDKERKKEQEKKENDTKYIKDKLMELNIPVRVQDYGNFFDFDYGIKHVHLSRNYEGFNVELTPNNDNENVRWAKSRKRELERNFEEEASKIFNNTSLKLDYPIKESFPKLIKRLDEYNS